MSGADRKNEIRERVAQLFARQGFHRSSMRDVAKATEMSLAGLYYHYRSKEEMLADIQRTCFEFLLDRHAEALAGVRDPAEKLRVVIRGHVTFFAEHLAEMKVLSRESETLEGELAEPVAELKRRYVRLVRGILDEIRPRRPELTSATAVFFLFGMMNWLYTWYDAERAEPDRMAADIHRIFLGGFLE